MWLTNVQAQFKYLTLKKQGDIRRMLIWT
jgi:hypothetical protein